MHTYDRLYQKKLGGAWYGWIYDDAGARRYVCTRCLDRPAAVAFMRRLERKAGAAPGAPEDAPAHTVEDALAYFLKEGASDVAPATRQMYATKSGHLLRLLGGEAVEALVGGDLVRRTFINVRLAEGAAATTVQKELVTLRLALATAQERGLLAVDPRACVPRFRARYVPKERYLTEEELAALLDALPEHRRCWVLVAVYTGARSSELAGLRWEEHVNLQTGWILLPGTKTAKARRKVPIAAALAEELHAQTHRQGPLVTPWPNHRRDLAEACARLGMPRVSPNDLRRTFASWLKQRGVDSMVVARLLGHTTSRMVELVYGHLNNAAFTQAVALLPLTQARSAAPPLAHADASATTPADASVTARADASATTRADAIVTARADASATMRADASATTRADASATTRADARRAPADDTNLRANPAIRPSPDAEPLGRGSQSVCPPRTATAAQPVAAARADAAKTGSQWVVNPVDPVRRMRQVRQPASQKNRQLAVPEGGVEPPTRGFSVPCSTS